MCGIDMGAEDEKVANFWKEPYEVDKACRLGIAGFENNCIVGDCWCGGVPTEIKYGRQMYRTCGASGGRESTCLRYGGPANRWIYYVTACNFTFAFFSLEHIRSYIKYYSAKILPSRRYRGMWANHNLNQSTFNRLPLYLRENGKRPRVVSALTRALAEFERDPSNEEAVARMQTTTPAAD